jgi:hypothetical protein
MTAPDQELTRPLAATPTDDPSRRFHGTLPPRGLDNVPRSTLYEGKFGRMFRNLPPLEPADADLAALAATMIEPTVTDDPAGDTPAITAGFTYLGQFIDHDLTFDPVSQLMRQNDPDALRNFRTPRFDLDSLYGAGPSDSPFLYEADGVRFVIGHNAAGEDDLPRNQPRQPGERRALIGDPRNDENLIVSQLHLALLKFHNGVADALAGQPDAPTGPALFEAARRTVQWHYQWMVVHDFLPTVVGPAVVGDVLKGDPYLVGTGGGDGTQQASVPKVDLRFFHWKNQPFMPVEFAVAAYRFGHSMIRADYELNADDQDIPIFQEPPDPTTGDLRGFRERPAGREIDWRRFFKLGNQPEVQQARKIDTKLSHGLGHLPPPVVADGPVSLAERNLKRGKALALPSGQDVAAAMGIPAGLRLTDADFTAAGMPAGLKATFAARTPLWYYVLAEARTKRQGRRLGPVGGRIVAEVFLGLLSGDPFSYLSVAPDWTPTAGQFGAGAGGKFGIAELLRFAVPGQT